MYFNGHYTRIDYFKMDEVSRMTSKQLIEILKNIKEHCTGRKCADCEFNIHLYECQIRELVRTLNGFPDGWDIGAIERTIKL